MTAPSSFGPCTPWTPIWCCDLPAGSAAVSGTMVQAATEVLWGLSGQQFGLCEVTIRPCRRNCNSDWPFPNNWWNLGDPWPRPLLYQGAWFNITCGGCGNGCSCTVIEEAMLPGPVASVTQVKLNGSVMVTGTYRIDDNRLLVRTDGGRWPICQDLSKDDSHDNTWSVTASFGQAVPTMGQLAVGELACEMIRACLGASCRLPQPVQQIVRQGISVTFLDPNEVFADGRVGLYNCDLFLSTVNPRRLAAAPAVYDVDGPSFRRTGT